MDEQETSDATAFGERTETVAETPDSTGMLKTAIVRIGWGICAFGLIITMIGTGMRATADSISATEGRGMHSFGLLILLFGAATTLLGYRLPWLAALMQAMQVQHNPGTRSQRHSTSQPGNLERQENALYLFPILVAGVGFCVLSFIISWLSPFVVTGLYLMTVTFFLAAAAIVVIASGTRLQRAFCIGAVIPLLMSVCNIWIYSFSAFSPAMRRSRPYPTEDLWTSLAEQAEMIVEMLTMLGSGTRVPILLTWIVGLAIGSSALVVRVLLIRINREHVDSASD